jgi:hypothetical protein
MIEQYQHRKYGSPRYKGPYAVDTVNDNGTTPPTAELFTRRGTYGIFIRTRPDPPCQIPEQARTALTHIKSPGECPGTYTHVSHICPQCRSGNIAMQYTSFSPLMTHSQYGVEGSPNGTSMTQTSPNHERACHERECSDVSSE